MRIKMGDGLLPLNLLVILLAMVIIFLPSNVVLRIILGFPFVLFFPGYALVAALYPRREGISGPERVVFSLGLSLAVVALIGLILNYTPWGIRLESILYATVAFIFIISGLACFRRKRLLEEERFSLEFHLALPGCGVSTRDKVLSIILAFAVLGALGMMVLCYSGTQGRGEVYRVLFCRVSQGVDLRRGRVSDSEHRQP